jgi:hypothetical protein
MMILKVPAHAKVCKNTKNMLARNVGLGAIAYLYAHKLKDGKN